MVNTGEILLLTRMVTYTWTVTPTTIADSYDFTLAFTYKTDVPAPAIIMSPSVFNFNLESDSAADGQIIITNQGLVSAFNVRAVPKTNDPHITIDMPYPAIRELKPGETVTVPFRVSLHSPPVCYQGSIDVAGTYTCAAGVEKETPPAVANINVNCGAPAGQVSAASSQNPGSDYASAVSAATGGGGSSVAGVSGANITNVTQGNPPVVTPPCDCNEHQRTFQAVPECNRYLYSHRVNYWCVFSCKLRQNLYVAKTFW